MLYQLVQKLNDVNRYLQFSDSIEFKINSPTEVYPTTNI